MPIVSFSRLVRKFGYDIVSAMVPKSDEVMHKRLKNIHKEDARKQRRREERGGNEEDEDEEDEFEGIGKRKSLKARSMDEILEGGSDDEDSAMEDEDSGWAKGPQLQLNKNKKKGGKQTYIVEDGGEGESVVDFLDPSAAQKVTSLRPKTKAESEAAEAADKKKKERAKNGGFDLAPDGRLLIKDDSDDDDDEDDQEMDADSDEESDGENTFKALLTSSRKRKRAGTSVASGATGRLSRATTAVASSERPMKYRAGGSGIHRAVGGRKGAAMSSAASAAGSAAPGSEYRYDF